MAQSQVGQHFHCSATSLCTWPITPNGPAGCHRVFPGRDFCALLIRLSRPRSSFVTSVLLFTALHTVDSSSLPCFSTAYISLQTNRSDLIESHVHHACRFAHHFHGPPCGRNLLRCGMYPAIPRRRQWKRLMVGIGRRRYPRSLPRQARQHRPLAPGPLDLRRSRRGCIDSAGAVMVDSLLVRLLPVSEYVFLSFFLSFWQKPYIK